MLFKVLSIVSYNIRSFFDSICILLLKNGSLFRQSTNLCILEKSKALLIQGVGYRSEQVVVRRSYVWAIRRVG